jgi:hypothetical protein
VQKRKRAVNRRALMIKLVTCGVKLIKETRNEPFLETTGQNIITDNPESVAEVVRTFIGDNLIQLLNEV